MAGLTVRDLVEMPHLQLEVLAGATGLDHAVTWAHASDLDTPWEWMTGSELLMKNGRTLPPGARDQVGLLREAAAVGIAGLVLGLDPSTPELQTEAIDTANALNFPLVMAAYSASFAAIGRVVADGNADFQGRRIARTERVYGLLQRSLALPDRSRVLRQLRFHLHCELAVLDAETGAAVLDGGDEPPEELRRAMVAAIAERGGALPGVVHLDAAGSRAQVVVVPDVDPTVLLTYNFAVGAPDSSLLQHVVIAVAVLLAQQGIEREQQRRVGAELFTNLIDLRLSEEELTQQLGHLDLSLEKCAITAVAGCSAPGERNLHLSLERHGVPGLLLRRGGLFYALHAPEPKALQLIQRRLGPSARLGVSDLIVGPDRAGTALREANWALRDASSNPSGLARYGETTLLSLLRDTDEARVVVERVLGSLIAYDEQHGTKLLETLETFLRHDRSWKAAAAAVGVHRQTLVYRLRRVEQITGRGVLTTAHLAELWLALRARELLSGNVSQDGV
jgi:purine catabolism regulator